MRSGELEIGGRGLAAFHRHLVADLLTVVQAFQSGGLHGGYVDEHILAAVLRHDEPIALGCIEPLDGSNGHRRHSFQCASPVALSGNGWIERVLCWLTQASLRFVAAALPRSIATS